MNTTSSSRQRFLPLLALLLITAWLAAGSLFKLFKGSPADLPASVATTLKTLGWGSADRMDLAFRLIITIELIVVALCLCKPKRGWIAIASMFALFLAILGHLVYIGAESCGCAGGSIKIAPIVMFSIDAALLLFLLITKPWSSLTTRGLPWGIFAALALVAIAAPWVVIGPLTDNTPPPPPVETIGEDPTERGPFQLPDPLPRYVVWNMDEWVDQELLSTPLATFIDPETLPFDGSIVFYRIDCDHCAEHLREMAMTDQATLPITLVQVVDSHEPGDPVIDMKPSGPHVTELALPKLTWAFETPWTMEVMAGIITTSHKNEHEDH